MKLETQSPFANLWHRMPTWLILVGGVLFGLVVTTVMMQWRMAPSADTMFIMVQRLVFWSAAALGLGLVVYRLCWNRSPSLTLTLSLSFILAALLTLFLVYVMARNMLAEQEDLAMAGIYLLFAAIIAVFFGIAVTSRVTASLRQLARQSQAIAEGDLTARVETSGRDEVAKMGVAFNQMAARLEAGEQQRREVEKLRRDLIAWTSHDLRTPLTSIRAMVEALHDGLVTDAETTHRYYATIRNDVIGLNKLIDDLFELAQLDAGGLQIELMPTSLGDLVSDALESLQALAAERQIQLMGSVAADVGLVPLNASRIGRVLTNLLGNALNYTPAGGCVRIDVDRTAEGARVIVQDDGPGFPEHDLPRVFEEFYRGEEARSRAMGSAGLGLAIARGIVDAHGGRIWAENAPAGGAVIGFVLPSTSPSL
ncbi:MAG: HAMP domain-containing protein [Anaerolineales bacterium]|nr:HAMP domain-containing protein [Anaerolineales bacterium]MCB0013966.1 HAMP domain-containing protein [Anaerolineales bacterium]